MQSNFLSSLGYKFRFQLCESDTKGKDVITNKVLYKIIKIQSTYIYSFREKIKPEGRGDWIEKLLAPQK